MLEILINTSPVYITIILGAILRKYKLIPKNAAETIGAVTFKIVVPFLVFNVLYGLKFDGDNIGLLFIAVLIFIVIGCGSWVLSKFLKASRETTGVIIISATSFAVGSFAYPFIQLNFVNEIFQNVVLMDIVLFFATLTIGYSVAVYYGDNNSSWKSIINKIIYNPIIISIFLTLILNYTNIIIPENIFDVSVFFAKSFGFLAALLIGLTIKLPDAKSFLLISKIFIFKNIFTVLVIFITMRFINFSNIEVNAIFLTAIVPFSTMAIIFAEEQNLNVKLAAQLSLLSLIAMLFIYPVLIVFLKG